MREFRRKLRSDAKQSRPYLLVLALAELVTSLFEHRILGAINDYIDHHDAPILDAVRPFSIWIVHTPFVLLIVTVCVILLHAYFSGRYESQHAEAPIDSLPPAHTTTNLRQEANPHIEVNPQFYFYPLREGPTTRKPIQEKKREPITHPPRHNIVFLGGDRYSPDKHGLVGGGIGCDKMRFVLAGFRNKHIVGSTVAHVYNVRAGVTYSDENGAEVLYVSPCEWLRQDKDTVKLESGGMSEFVLLAAYNYGEKRWESHKMVQVRHYMGDSFRDEPRTLPFGTITADVVLLEKDGTALEGGSVTFELRANGDFTIR